MQYLASEINPDSGNLIHQFKDKQASEQEQFFKHIERIAYGQLRYLQRAKSHADMPDDVQRDIVADAYLAMLEPVSIEDQEKELLYPASYQAYRDKAIANKRTVIAESIEEYIFVRRISRAVNKAYRLYRSWYLATIPLAMKETVIDSSDWVIQCYTEDMLEPDIDIIFSDTYKDKYPVTDEVLLIDAVAIYSRGWHNVNHIAKQLNYNNVNELREALCLKV